MATPAVFVAALQVVSNNLVFLGRVLSQESGPIIAIALVSGGVNMAVLHVIRRMLEGGGSERLSTYAVLCLASLVTAIAGRWMAERAAARISYSLRLELTQKLLRAPFADMERIPSGAIVAAVANDLPAVVVAARALPVITTNGILVVGGLVYLVATAGRSFVYALPVMIVTVAAVQVIQRRMLRATARTRRLVGVLEERFQDVVSGAKELRLSRPRHVGVAEGVAAAAEGVRAATYRQGFYLGALDGIVRIGPFVIIGSTIGFAGMVGIDLVETAGAVLVLLYLLGPLQALMQGADSLNRANVAFQALERVGAALVGRVAADGDSVVPEPGAVHHIDFDEVQHQYDDSDRDPFVLGPISMDLRPGTITMIVGGNGSGKSTLVKLLCGLYAPARGTVRLNGVDIDSSNIEWYRNHFSVVFFEYHLFAKVWGAAVTDGFDPLMKALKLAGRVELRDGTFSTLKLSSGQRRRLALVAALLEDRPVYIFDEWSSDQDVEFKEYFYRVLLPGLRARGKVVIVVSHDDRYFHIADEKVKLERGRQLGEETSQFLVRLREG